MQYNKKLAERFVKDFNIPAPIVDDIHYLNYFIELYNCKDKWEKVVNEVDSKFNGDAEAFIEEYYKVKKNVIDTMHNKPEYQDFVEAKMDFKHSNKVSAKHKSIYNADSLGRVFLSIDVAEGNFQSMKHFNPALVDNCKNYDEWITRFTDLEYFRNNKYTRQRIFGELNPKRQRSIETEMIYRVYEDYFKGIQPEVFNGDEMIFEYNGLDYSNFENELYERYGIHFHVELFGISIFDFVSALTKEKIFTFYIKDYIEPDKPRRIVEVPLRFRAMVEKLLNGQEVTMTDKIFKDANVTNMIMEDFVIKPF